MTACSRCGSSARLRFDRVRGVWVCADRCGSTRRPTRRRREPLFALYLVDDGTRRRSTRDELREAHRIWSTHADLRGDTA